MQLQEFKKVYSAPSIERIKLDSEISLSIQSFGDDPFEPGDLSKSNNVPDYFGDGLKT